MYADDKFATKFDKVEKDYNTSKVHSHCLQKTK